MAINNKEIRIIKTEVSNSSPLVGAIFYVAYYTGYIENIKKEIKCLI